MTSRASQGPLKGFNCVEPNIVHNEWQLYHRPCLQCLRFCNCNYTYFGKSYPDAWVWSLDKKLVRLSGELVQASLTLKKMADDILNCKTTSFEWCRVCPESMRDGGDKFQEIMQFPPRKSMLLYDINDTSNSPTLGITKAMLEKINYFIYMHLDDVDMKIEAERRHEIHTEEVIPRRKHLLISEENQVNTFAFEDWEEEFFSVDIGTFLELRQANVELKIWDLHWALEKWTVLFRGTPRLMDNGWYDIFQDPDFDENDVDNVFGLFNIPYYNPRRRSTHKKGFYQFEFQLSGPPLSRK